MNNEIKEMTKVLKSLGNKQASELYNYITNLQQYSLSLAKENEQEKQFIKDCGLENVQQLVIDYIGIRQEKEDYKSRIEKATNKVQYIIDIGFDYDGYNDVDNLKILVDELVDLARQTKNILNGKE